MGLSLFMLPFAVAAVGQPPVPESDQPSQNVEIRGGHHLVPLPFRLNLDPRARPPRSLTEMVDRIYRALPQERIDMFAAFHTDRDFERVRANYDSTVAFWYGLHTIEILHEAGRVWGFYRSSLPTRSRAALRRR